MERQLQEEEKAPEDDALDDQDSVTGSEAERSPAERSTDGSSDTDIGDGSGGVNGVPVSTPPQSTDKGKGNAPENGPSGGDRSRERLAWRCVQAARAAASLVPPLTAHALLPAAALRLPHSCAPAVRVPAGDRRSYNAHGGGGAGQPLIVAMVALRDIPAGAPLSCSWVDAQEPCSARMSRLRKYSRVTVVPPTPTSVAGLGESEGPRAPEGAGGCGGCGCSKCAVESHGTSGRGEDSGRSGLAVERLLEAARQAVDEDR